LTLFERSCLVYSHSVRTTEQKGLACYSNLTCTLISKCTNFRQRKMRNHQDSCNNATSRFSIESQEHCSNKRARCSPMESQQHSSNERACCSPTETHEHRCNERASSSSTRNSRPVAARFSLTFLIAGGGNPLQLDRHRHHICLRIKRCREEKVYSEGWASVHLPHDAPRGSELANQMFKSIASKVMQLFHNNASTLRSKTKPKANSMQRSHKYRHFQVVAKQDKTFGRQFAYCQNV
jgi:hypothetical protein